MHPTRKAKDHLWALAASNGIDKKRVDHVLGLVGLSDVADKRVGGFSLGMKQRLGLAATMLGDPQTGTLTNVQLTRLVQIMAVRGNVKAQRCLGIMYVKGVGVVRNLVRAEKWLVAAAEQGDGEAMYALSELYSLGGRGIEKSEDKANRYRQGSAVQGFQPVRSEFLRLLESAPPPDSPPPGRGRRHYRHGGGGEEPPPGE